MDESPTGAVDEPADPAPRGPLAAARDWLRRRSSGVPAPTSGIPEPALPTTPGSAGARSEAGSVHRQALIWRILDGDADALDEAAKTLGLGDPSARTAWTVQLQRFREAILDLALEAGLVDLPSEDPFWGSFSREQQRLVLDALATLGHHFDGIGGWRDQNQPARRDLSLALGYAGIDPVRVRSWPTPAGTQGLLVHATIAGAEYLEREAPDLSGPQISRILRPYGARLSALVNEWDRVREVLLAVPPPR